MICVSWAEVWGRGEVPGKGVGPKCMRIFRIADGDVTAHSFGVALAGEDAEGACLREWLLGDEIEWEYL